MNFCTIEDFQSGEWKLPQSIVDNTDFEADCTRYEEEILRKVFGHEFYDQVIANGLYLPEVIWSNIVSGCYYTRNNIKYKWEGITKAVVPYLCAKFVQLNYDLLTENGVQESKIENATKISPNQRIIRAYNVFAHLIGSDCSHVNSLYGLCKSDLVSYSAYKYWNPRTINQWGLR